jgi:nitric oxide reductase NorQ protein
VALEFDYPQVGLEQKIVQNESGVSQETAARLVKFAHMTRNLKGSGLDEGASTRLLVHAAKLIHSGVDPVVACRSSIAQTLTDDVDMLAAVNELSAALF